MQRTIILMISIIIFTASNSYLEAAENDWSKVFAALSRALKAPKAPALKGVDLYGKAFDLAKLRGKVVLVACVDRKSQNEAIHWLQKQPVFHLGRQDLAYVNLIYPGGVFFLVPRGEAVVRIRAQINKATKQVTAGLNPTDRRHFEETEIHWFVDWKRKIMGRFGAFPGRVNFFVINHEGRIAEVVRRLNSGTTRILDESIRIALLRRQRALQGTGILQGKKFLPKSELSIDHSTVISGETP